MFSRMLRLATAVIVAIITLVAAPARGASRDSVELDYVAPAGCPDHVAVEAAVRERAHTVVVVPHAARVFAISIAARGDDYVGTMSTSGDQASTRELSAHRCDELVVALALVTALAIETSTGEGHPVPAVEKPRWPIDATAATGIALGITPDVMPILAIEGRSAVRPQLLLALAGVFGYDRAEIMSGAARFVWMTGRPTACWLPLRGRIELAACGHVEAGLIRATGQHIVLGQSISRAWWATGVHLDAQYRINHSNFIELQVGTEIPLQRDRYLFQPSTTIHQAAVVVGWVAVGLGIHFR
jgi:hypothetical protein